MLVLVTGGAGFIGSNTVDMLIDSGHSVIVIDNESSDCHDQFYWNSAAQNYKLDICNYEDIRGLFDNVDCVLHLAAEARIQPSLLNPSLTIKTNSLGTANVLQCSLEAGVKRFVYSSTSSAYGNNETPNIESQASDCLTPYSASKVFGENLCKVYSNLFNLETIVLRYFNVYGPREPLRGRYAPVIGMFKKQKSLGQPLTIIGDGKQKRDFTHVHDVAKANALALTEAVPADLLGTVFNIGSGSSHSINDIAKMYRHQTINIPPRVGESRATLANNNKAAAFLNWKPEKSLESWINNDE